jgi:2-polyprenyl-3-methyl-5-hydroxy-6-metoxy-1,4-benzoquinol methylase
MVCPECGADLRIESAARSDADIASGELVCVAGAHRFPIRDSIPRFVASDQYADAFALEWNSFRTDHLDSFTGLDYLDSQLQSCLDFPLDELEGKIVLDAGCGLGRFTEICLNHGAQVVAVDLSGAIDAACKNLNQRDGVHFLQADIFKLPLKAEAFDFVYSWGVLHHTPDPPHAFAQLPPLVKPGGKLMTFVYSNYNKAYLATTELYRKVTTRLPQKLLLRLCYVAIPLYYVSKVPLLGPFLTRILLPVSVRPPTHRWRVGNTFDLYSPAYAYTYDHVEVHSWFRDAGLSDITPMASGGGVTYVARRPE